MFYQCVAAGTLFYTAHWQTYVSGTLQFGKFDVTEAQFTIIAIHLISAIFGTQIWSSVIPLGFMNVELKLAMTILTLGGAVINIFWYLSSICSGGSGKNGSTIAGTSIISPLSPIASVVVSAIIIYIKSPTNLYETNPCLYLLTFGLVIAKVTNKLVVSSLLSPCLMHRIIISWLSCWLRLLTWRNMKCRLWIQSSSVQRCSSWISTLIHSSLNIWSYGWLW